MCHPVTLLIELIHEHPLHVAGEDIVGSGIKSHGHLELENLVRGLIGSGELGGLGVEEV